MIAFADSDNSPVILLNRNDIEDDDKSAKDSATGMVKRNGKWEIQEQMKRLLLYVHYNKYDELSGHVLYQLEQLRPLFLNLL